ncbi:MAG: hypothetical protein CMD07_05855 [Flavobacteriales bacterium]|nr:hypothetical protein [Flavobacteriales bacterium]
MKNNSIYIIIKYHMNPSSESNKALPVLMMDTDDHPLEFDRLDSAEEFVNILNMNSNQGLRYEIKELGLKYLKVTQKDND